MSLDELKDAVASLPPDKLGEFRAWFDSYMGGDTAGRDADEVTEAESTVTFHAIRHLVGIGEGSDDLVTNPKHLDNFGRSSMS
ncbi:MAG: hypothetical protein AAFR91_09750 [Pseudomonadota bacterium]